MKPNSVQRLPVSGMGRQDPAETLDEHDRVALVETISSGGTSLPSGSVGTIISIGVPDEVFVVEFTRAEVIITLNRQQIRLFERLHH